MIPVSDKYSKQVMLLLQRLHNPRGPREGVVYAIDEDENTVGTKAINYVLYY